ncbi:hypothetical protein ACPPVO_24060 [Dactylosporangium sp. McL0621]|uniref:hypothetical protein n=1 Tax=Dactylosporangium sp. McL0621 TaxID=3415678 RepID=UPI003CE7673B
MDFAADIELAPQAVEQPHRADRPGIDHLDRDGAAGRQRLQSLVMPTISESGIFATMSQGSGGFTGRWPVTRTGSCSSDVTETSTVKIA